ncbi:thioredoxin family protein [Paenibacillus glucanolyticus]|uniref:thioredoxin family protein n=1 Tax=Paenibacillus glucanolyticus TaxID=59843 RepID=UPI0030C992DD
MSLPRLESSSFQSAIKPNGVTLVEFGATWCPPCKVLLPILEELSHEEAGRLDIYQVDCDESPELAAQFGIMSMPTVIVFHNGEPADKLIGLRPKSAYQAALGRYVS